MNTEATEPLCRCSDCETCEWKLIGPAGLFTVWECKNCGRGTVLRTYYRCASCGQFYLDENREEHLHG